jgi:hypothetical protein
MDNVLAGAPCPGARKRPGPNSLCKAKVESLRARQGAMSLFLFHPSVTMAELALLAVLTARRCWGCWSCWPALHGGILWDPVFCRWRCWLVGSAGGGDTPREAPLCLWSRVGLAANGRRQPVKVPSHSCLTLCDSADTADTAGTVGAAGSAGGAGSRGQFWGVSAPCSVLQG